MAEELNKGATDVLLKVTIDANETLQELNQLQNEVQRLRDEQKALEEQGHKNTQTYTENAEAIKALNKRAQERSKVLQNQIKQMHEEADSLQAMKARLSEVTLEYNKLSKADREGSVGKEKLKEIRDLTEQLNEAEQAMLNFHRNVGNYQSALQGVLPLNSKFAGILQTMSSSFKGGVKEGFNQVTTAAKGFGKQLWELVKNPIVATVAAIALVVMKVVEAFKRNEEATNAIKRAMSALNPIMDAVKRGFDFIANTVGKLAELLANGLTQGIKGVMKLLDKFGKAIGKNWNFEERYGAEAKAAADLTKAEQDYLKHKRDFVVEEAKLNKEIAKDRDIVAQSDKYSLKERIAALDRAIANEEKIAKKRLKLAQEAEAIAKKEAARGANDAATNDALAQATADRINAEAELQETTRRLKAQRASLIGQSNKQAQADSKATAKKKELTDAEKEQIEQEKTLQKLLDEYDESKIASITKKYDDAKAALLRQQDALSKELQQLNDNGQGSGDRAKQISETLTKNNAIMTDFERKKAQEIQAINAESARKQIDTAIELINQGNEEQLALYADQEQKKLAIAVDAKKQEGDTLAKMEEEAQTEEAKKAIRIQRLQAEAELRQLQSQQIIQGMNEELSAEISNQKTIYEIKRASLEAQLALYEGNAEKVAEIRAQMEALDKERTLQMIDSIGGYAQKAMEMLGGLDEFVKAIEDRQLEEYQTNNETKKADLQDRLEQGLINQEQYDAAVAQADAELDAKRKKMERAQAIRQRALNLMNAAMNTALSISTTLAQLGIPAGIPAMAVAAALGAVQVATIAAQPLPKAAKGAYLSGPSHAQGGINIEAEGGEAIINKKSTSMFLPLLSAINEAGGGVKFAHGGMVGGSSRVIDNAISQTNMMNAIQNVRVYTAITDIHRGEANYSTIVNNAAR